ncbi:MAG TPA: hypothetical protein VFZ34_24700 [Blastocatellia bacterium]|nr:hypothetical protein [Blastocatellia bacterium]
MKRTITNIHRHIIRFMALCFTIGTLSLAASAQDHHDHGQEMKAPQTAQEHRARADEYEKKAAEHRNEAAAHQKMLKDYSKTVARNPKDTGENAYIRKMRLHCEKYIKAAEALAVEAEEMAKFHKMRAKEIEGK